MAITIAVSYTHLDVYKRQTKAPDVALLYFHVRPQTRGSGLWDDTTNGVIIFITVLNIRCGRDIFWKFKFIHTQERADAC